MGIDSLTFSTVLVKKLKRKNNEIYLMFYADIVEYLRMYKTLNQISESRWILGLSTKMV